MIELRVARPTDRLEEIERQYVEGLGFERLGGFEDHEGFDGVMLGHRGAGYHLEFTHERSVPAGGAPSPEHLLVFYFDEEAKRRATCERMRQANWQEVPAHNPYWNRNGTTFTDVDGYRVVLVRYANTSVAT